MSTGLITTLVNSFLDWRFSREILKKFGHTFRAHGAEIVANRPEERIRRRSLDEVIVTVTSACFDIKFLRGRGDLTLFVSPVGQFRWMDLDKLQSYARTSIPGMRALWGWDDSNLKRLDSLLDSGWNEIAALVTKAFN